jgi:hypothetical protein
MNRSTLTLVAILGFGLLFLGGLYWGRATTLPAEYRNATPGLPARPLRLITVDAEWKPPSAELLEQLRGEQMDFLLLQRISRKDAEALANELGFRHGGRMQMFYSASNPNGAPSLPGNAILSKHPLYKGRESPHTTPAGYAVLAEPVVDGKRFTIASADFAKQEELETLLTQWEKTGKPPLAVGGRLSRVRVSLPFAQPRDQFLTSPEIQTTTGPTVWPTIVIQP